ncbi:hypothetical protein HMPREF0262_01657 [Clostridium sp. ATCC 29733]|nr:hypothetical protein HMPREF0262_01657 [Clostridium sp. ATCC 29733]
MQKGKTYSHLKQRYDHLFWQVVFSMPAMRQRDEGALQPANRASRGGGKEANRDKRALMKALFLKRAPSSSPCRKIPLPNRKPLPPS